MSDSENPVPAPAPEAAPPAAPLPAAKKPTSRLALWIGLAAIGAFLVFGLSAFNKTLTPYVSFDEARRSQTVVQVAGGLVKGSDTYDEKAQELRFSIIDDRSDQMVVVYKGIRPGNFNDAVSVVAIGKWDGSSIQAEKLLVKCPSKYQGQEVQEYPAAKS